MVVVYPPTLDFAFMRQRPQQLMLQFARHGHQVYFCNQNQRPGQPPEEMAPNLWVVHDHVDFVQRIVPALAPTLVWSSWARQHELVEAYHPTLVVYDCVDDFPEWRLHEPAMLARADAVFTTSRALFDRLRPLHQQVALVPNGCDFAFFQARPAGPPPADLPAAGPRAGFVGAWGAWIDSDLMHETAVRLPHWQFILIGCNFGGKPVFGPNIHNLGMRPYEQLPHYLHHIDVALIPFQDSEITRAANPVKLWEYLAAGRPVVSTPLPEVLPYAHLVRIGSRLDFAPQIEAALGDQHQCGERQELARQNSWAERYRAIAAALPALAPVAPETPPPLIELPPPPAVPAIPALRPTKSTCTGGRLRVWYE